MNDVKQSRGDQPSVELGARQSFSRRADFPIITPERAPTCPAHAPAQHDYCLIGGIRDNHRLWKRTCYSSEVAVFDPDVEPLDFHYLCPWGTRCVRLHHDSIRIAADAPGAVAAAAVLNDIDPRSSRSRSLRRGRARMACVHQWFGLRELYKAVRRGWHLRGTLATELGIGGRDAAADAAAHRSQIYAKQSVVRPIVRDDAWATD